MSVFHPPLAQILRRFGKRSTGCGHVHSFRAAVDPARRGIIDRVRGRALIERANAAFAFIRRSQMSRNIGGRRSAPAPRIRK
jgi:hypothetical protein